MVSRFEQATQTGGCVIDTRILEALEMGAELLGRADPARSAGLRQRGPSPFISRPDIGTAGLVLAENIVMRQRVAEELESVLAATFRFLGVGMHREARHHRDIGVDCVTDRTHSVLMMR